MWDLVLTKGNYTPFNFSHVVTACMRTAILKNNVIEKNCLENKNNMGD